MSSRSRKPAPIPESKAEIVAHPNAGLMKHDDGTASALEELKERAAKVQNLQELYRLVSELNAVLEVVEDRLAELDGGND